MGTNFGAPDNGVHFTQEKPNVNVFVSDLFFNMDHDGAKTKDNAGQFAGFDEAVLRENAETLRGCLSGLGLKPPPVDDLLADFRNRL